MDNATFAVNFAHFLAEALCVEREMPSLRLSPDAAHAVAGQCGLARVQTSSSLLYDSAVCGDSIAFSPNKMPPERPPRRNAHRPSWGSRSPIVVKPVAALLSGQHFRVLAASAPVQEIAPTHRLPLNPE